MKTKLLFLITLCLVLAYNSIAQVKQNYVPGRLVVKVRRTPTNSAQSKSYQTTFWQQLPEAKNIKKVYTLRKKISQDLRKNSGKIPSSDIYILDFESGTDIKSLIQKYRSSGLFEYVELDYMAYHAGRKLNDILPNDQYFYNRQWSHYNDGTFNKMPATEDADIDMHLAWSIEKGDTAVVVAILDTGINPYHPEFSGRIWRNHAENPSIPEDNDRNGYYNDFYGWDFINNDNQPVDDNGHGTNVAGLLGAKGNNRLGYAGVDWNCRLMPCKVLDNQGGGSYSAIAEGIYYAVDHGAHIINMSLGGNNESQLLKDAIEYAHQNEVLVIASMMNFNNDELYYPAAYKSTLAVGATDADDSRSAPFFWEYHQWE